MHRHRLRSGFFSLHHRKQSWTAHGGLIVGCHLFHCWKCMKEERDDSLAFEGVFQNVTPDKRGLGGGGKGGRREGGEGEGKGERDDERVA